MGLLYATVLAIGLGLAVLVFAASTWLLSVLLLALVLRPYFYRFKTRMKRVPEGLSASVEADCARHGVAVRRSWLAQDAPGFGTAEIAGLLPWDRHFVVEEWFFASLSPSEREALVARETALVRARYSLFSHVAGPTIVAGVASLLAIETVIPTALGGANTWLLFSGACAFLYGLAARYGIEKIHAADRHAARETSPETVEDLLEGAERESKESAWHRWPISLLAMTPTIDQRLDRLRTLRE